MTDEVAPWDSEPPGAKEVAPWDSPDPTAAQAPPETAGRVAGLGTRALGEGAADTGSMITNAMEQAQGPAATPLKAIQAAVPTSTSKEPTLSDFIHPDRWKNAVDYLADKAGLASPQTDAEKIGSKAVEALPSAVMAPEAPIMGGISAALGAGASEAVKQGGGGPLAQTAAGLGAGSLGAVGAAGAAGLRGIVRGGAEGQAAMQQRLADAAASGNTKLSVGQAGGKAPAQYLQGVLNKFPGSGPLKELPGEQTESIGNRIDSIVENLSGGADVSPTGAGSAIEKGTASTLKSMRGQEDVAYNKLDSLVPADAPIDVSRTLGLLDEIAKPIPGAEATTGALVSKPISDIRDNLTADMAANAAKNEPPSYINNTRAPQPDAMAETIASEKQASTLPYSALSGLRTRVGSKINWGFAPADPQTNGALKRIYGQLTNDLNDGTTQISPQARQASDAARTLYAKNQDTREFLDNIVDQNGGPESVFKAATNGTRDGATKIKGVMAALNPDQQKLVQATVLDKLGRTGGAQDAPISPATFLTNWTKIDPLAKNELFGKTGNSGDLRSGLDSLSNTVKNIQQGTKLQAPKLTGEQLGHSAGMLAAFEGVRELMTTGNLHTLAWTGGAMGLNNVLSRGLTNPTIVKWLARSTRAPASALPNAVNQLSRINHPDAQALAAQLNPPAPIARASGGKVDIDALVDRLMKRWHQAKRDGDAGTKQLLKVPDEAIAQALKIAERHT